MREKSLVGKSGKVVEASPELLCEPLIIESRGCRLSHLSVSKHYRADKVQKMRKFRGERERSNKGGREGRKEGGEWKLNFVTNTRTNVDAAGPALRPRR